MVSDLRESGSIEQDADMVILLHREDIYDKESPRAGEADVIVAKHRNGPTKDIVVALPGPLLPLRQHGGRTRLVEVSPAWAVPVLGLHPSKLTVFGRVEYMAFPDLFRVFEEFREVGIGNPDIEHCQGGCLPALVTTFVGVKELAFPSAAQYVDAMLSPSESAS